MKIQTILGMLIIANLTMTSCSKSPSQSQSAAPSNSQSEEIVLNEVNIVLDAAKKTAQNAAEAYDLGIVSSGQVKKSRYYISNTTGSNINLTFTDLMAQVAQNSRFTIANNSCSSILKNLKTCYFDISLNYVTTISAEDYQVPLITTIVAGAANPEFGKILFSGLKATDVTSQTALLSVLRPDRLSEAFIVPANQSVTKRFYLSNIGTKAITTPSINAPTNGVISLNTCSALPSLKIAGTCYFDLTYSSDLAVGQENYNSAITFSSTDPLLDPTGLQIAVSITNQPVIVPAISVSFNQVGTIKNLATQTDSSRIYIANTGSNDIDTSTIVLPSQYVISGTSCATPLKIGKSCFYDLKIDPTKTENMISLVSTVTIGSSSTQIKSGVMSNIATTCSSGFNPINNSCISNFTPSVTRVTLNGGQISIEGSGLAGSTSLQIKKANGTIVNTNSIVSSSGALTAQLTEMVNFAMNEAFQLIIGDAHAQSVPVDLVFSVNDHSLTTQKLAGPLGGVGVSSGQMLVWNGTDWVATSPASSQLFISTYDASTGLPALSASPVVGDYYIVSKDGSQDINGTGSVAYKVGDQLMFDGAAWKRIASSSLITSVFGRIGAVTAQAGDYTWAMLEKVGGKLKDSALGDIADVDFSTAPQADQFLGYDTVSNKWIPKTVIIPSQQVLNSNINDSEIAMSKISGLDTALSGLSTLIGQKEPLLPVGGTASQYLGGDKAWHDLSTDVNSIVASSLSSKADLTNMAQSITASNLNITTINGQAYPGFADYVTAASAASTYATQSGVNALLGNYLTTASAASTYATQASLNSYVARIQTSGTSFQVKGFSSGSDAFPSGDAKAALDIAGSAITRTFVLANTAGGVDLSKSNSISITTQSAAAVALNNIQDGGAYTISMTASSTLTPSFTATKAEDGSAIAGANIKVYPTLTARTSGKHFVMSATRIGDFVYISWQEF